MQYLPPLVIGSSPALVHLRLSGPTCCTAGRVPMEVCGIVRCARHRTGLHCTMRRVDDPIDLFFCSTGCIFAPQSFSNSIICFRKTPMGSTASSLSNMVRGILPAFSGVTGGADVPLIDTKRRSRFEASSRQSFCLSPKSVLHMFPAGLAALGPIDGGVWLLGGFAGFLALEQFLNWRHCSRASAACRNPMTYLVFLGDALHNLLGGLSIAAHFWSIHEPE